jgi:hypothetical protein
MKKPFDAEVQALLAAILRFWVIISVLNCIEYLIESTYAAMMYQKTYYSVEGEAQRAQQTVS